MRLGIKFIFLFFFSGSFIWGQVKIGDNVEVLNPAAVFEHYFIGESFFQPHYQFMSLVEVKEFIQKHHHLPNVFSRKEIEKQGGIKLNVALEQQLEKIEELFLYAIEQEKRINYLEAKLQEIEPCIAEQKKR